MKQDKLKLAYYAGFLDGEGSFVIVRRNHSNGIQLSGRVTVSNTYKPILEEIQEYFDEGSVFANNRETKTCKMGYRLDIQNFSGVIKIVEQLLPFLREKKERAEVLLRFSKRRQLPGQGRGHPYTTDDFEDYFLLRKLNKTGPTY